MQYAIDYSWSRPVATAIKDAGIVTVCRYLSRDTTGKTLTKPEADALHAAGLGILLNFEDSSTRSAGGAAAGKADAEFANQLADKLGAPGDIPIYYSVDTDPGLPVRPVVIDYFRGIASAGERPVGVYGGAVLWQALSSLSLARFGWVANASSWNHGMGTAGAHLHQLYGHPAGSPSIPGVPGGVFDVSEILDPNHGQWGGTSPQEDDLDTNQAAQLQAIYNAFNTGSAEKNANVLSDIHNWTEAIFKRPAVSASGSVDPAAVADAVLKGLTPAVAKAVADELYRRLQG